jgi:hypothetical protein
MLIFRLLLITIFVMLVGFTALVIARHGLDFLPIFFGDIAAVGWPGQFNADFMSLLTLSAVWTAWRGQFSVTALALAFLAFNLGGVFLSLYLLWLSWHHKGDVKAIMLGRHVEKARVQ